ncbi:hypothetical protein [Fictibacillus sp. 18YEL24]|uniref:hypothetical protein n=1 Tax=Fictibacillus sp. 18YEL24 TaxID=2745875 RepID=UPI0018CDC579|nr:hypothetical protein [Fictibacillus sp. 18YEL24]MBH0171468.1 hypothetical protein [Fictibacillus sp. 18YEL24]
MEMPVIFKDTGKAILENYIAIHEERSTTQQLKTGVCPFFITCQRCKFEQESSRIREAEAVADVVMNHFGYETGGYSFAYIAGWTQDINIMKQIENDIVTCSHQVIEKLKSTLRSGNPLNGSPFRGQ